MPQRVQQQLLLEAIRPGFLLILVSQLWSCQPFDDKTFSGVKKRVWKQLMMMMTGDHARSSKSERVAMRKHKHLPLVLPPAPPIRTTDRRELQENPQPSLPLHAEEKQNTASLKKIPTMCISRGVRSCSKERPPRARNNTYDSRTQTLKHSHVRPSLVIYGLFLNLDVTRRRGDWRILTSCRGAIGWNAQALAVTNKRYMF